MHLKSAVTGFCLLFAVWAADAQAQELGCPNLQVAVDSVAFPEEAIKLGISEGNAVVAFTVGADGEVVGKEVKSATQPIFGEAALAIVSRLRCDKHSLSWQAQLPVDFRLRDAPSPALAEKLVCEEPAAGKFDFVRDAVRLGVTRGRVVVEFNSDADGRATDVVILESTHELFSKYALRFAKRLSCTPIGHKFRIPLSFSIT
ncbi:TonB family protein [Rhizobacter sp. SG703]|uniref:TonB family protein n=1 Tax=Rhizobacter sp. SG703 TaxID=2587140 RepID=UPI00144685B4|nr:TonB family protein [Rhizobacter sp. SG703]NKI97123.1 TonB family protein [Rhizobacter sp. SG703]